MKNDLTRVKRKETAKTVNRAIHQYRPLTRNIQTIRKERKAGDS